MSDQPSSSSEARSMYVAPTGRSLRLKVCPRALRMKYCASTDTPPVRPSLRMREAGIGAPANSWSRRRPRTTQLSGSSSESLSSGPHPSLFFSFKDRSSSSLSCLQLALSLFSHEYSMPFALQSCHLRKAALACSSRSLHGSYCFFLAFWGGKGKPNFIKVALWLRLLPIWPSRRKLCWEK